jgi:hypothetical protein
MQAVTKSNIRKCLRSKYLLSVVNLMDTFKETTQIEDLLRHIHIYLRRFSRSNAATV